MSQHKQIQRDLDIMITAGKKRKYKENDVKKIVDNQLTELLVTAKPKLTQKGCWCYVMARSVHFLQIFALCWHYTWIIRKNRAHGTLLKTLKIPHNFPWNSNQISLKHEIFWPNFFGQNIYISMIFNFKQNIFVTQIKMKSLFKRRKKNKSGIFH